MIKYEHINISIKNNIENGIDTGSKDHYELVSPSRYLKAKYKT